MSITAQGDILKLFVLLSPTNSLNPKREGHCVK